MKRSEISCRAKARKTGGTVALRWGNSCSTYSRMSLSQFFDRFGGQIAGNYDSFYSIFDMGRLERQEICELCNGSDGQIQIGIELGHFVFDSCFDGYAYLEEFGDASFVSYRLCPAKAEGIQAIQERKFKNRMTK